MYTMNLKITVNNKELTATSGETILEVLNRNGIDVPTLCHMKDYFPSGACRMCIVEHEQSGKLIPSCSFPVMDGMKLMTHSPRVVESRKTIVELLLSNHPDDCLYCARNSNCELQQLAINHHVTERNIVGNRNNLQKDLSSASIARDPDKCILCGRCVRVCEEAMGVSAIDYIFRGSKTFIGTAFNKGLNTSSCVNCGQCILVCPTGALTEKEHLPDVIYALNDPTRMVVVQHAPAISVSIAEEFNLDPGKDYTGIINAALRRIGFDRVFDTSFAADLTILEEASELISRIQEGGKLPMFTSCCPAWVKYVEEFAPDFISNLSTCKSPQQMLGSVIKNYFARKENIDPATIYSVSIMPCTAKKFESQREDMVSGGIMDVDAVLTTREFASLIRQYGIDLASLVPELSDSPLGMRSSAGKLFGGTGGVMEAALRTAQFYLSGNDPVNYRITELRGLEQVKIAKLPVNGMELGVAVISGLGNVKNLLEEIRGGRNDIHFIEVMTCPGGCIAGGGQFINAESGAIRKRIASLYAIDDDETLKFSHKNPEIIELYEKFLVKPLGHCSHELLHTRYQEREVMK